MFIIGFIAGFVLGILGGLLVALYLGTKWGKQERPYAWKCTAPGCTTQCSSNDPAWTDQFIRNHQREKHGVEA